MPNKVGCGHVGAQAQVHDPDVIAVLVVHHVLDTLDDVGVGAGAVGAQHPYAENFGIRGDAQPNPGVLVGDVVPDETGYVRAMAVAVVAVIFVAETVALVLVAAAAGRAGAVAHKIDLAKELAVEHFIKLGQNPRLIVDAAVQHSNANTFAGHPVGVNPIGPHIQGDGVDQCPGAHIVGGLGIGATVIRYRNIVAGDPAVPHRLVVSAE
jgi:hypothetical protein